MSQFRQDIITKQWVLIAPKRTLRPADFEAEKNTFHPPEVDPACVFCPGNEALNPDIIMAVPSERNWRVRVIPNKYEALSHKAMRPLDRSASDFYLTRPGIGDHEVIIMRSHNKPFALQDKADMEMAVKVWLARFNGLHEHPEVRYVHILQNHGQLSGASIYHPHFQVLTTPFIPNHLNDELSGAAAYHRSHERCVYCDMVELERKDGSRMVYENDDFAAFCLFAARVPFQIRVIPKKHAASFTSITSSQVRGLADILKKVLGSVHEKLNDAPYNFYIHTIPVCSPTPAFCDPASYHWHLEILPRVNVWAGFELGTEIYINPVAPEDAAAFLRGEK